MKPNYISKKKKKTFKAENLKKKEKKGGLLSGCDGNQVNPFCSVCGAETEVSSEMNFCSILVRGLHLH